MKTKNQDQASPAAINFEESLDQLEQLVTQIENGELTLDESLKVFEKGIKLTQNCQKTLTDAEQKVKILTENQELADVEYE